MSDASTANPFLFEDSAIRSLNRVRVAALTGLAVENGVLGQTALDLLSAASLRQQVVDASDRLRLDPAAPDLLRRFDTCFSDRETLPHAAEIARRYGRRIGCLLTVLRRGEIANREARPEWTAAHWAFWKSIGRVCVGGGLLAGKLGRLAVREASVLLEEAGVSDLEVDLAPHGAYLPLVGLARSAPRDATDSLLFDFGNTTVKRGHARYQAGKVIALDLWADAPSVCSGSLACSCPEGEIRHRWQRMAEMIAECWTALPAARRQSIAIGICLACYLFDGHPSPRDRGYYADLQRLSPNLAGFVAGELARRLGQVVAVNLLHDGAAAATVYAGSDRTVVLTFGTSIGSGFPQSAGDLWPVTDGFAPGGTRPVVVGDHGSS